MNENIESRELVEMREQYQLLKDQIGTVSHIKDYYLKNAIKKDMNKRSSSTLTLIAIAVILIIPNFIDSVFEGNQRNSLITVVLLGFCILLFYKDRMKYKKLSLYADDNVTDAQNKLLLFYEKKANIPVWRFVLGSIAAYFIVGILSRLTRHGIDGLFNISLDYILYWTVFYLIIWSMIFYRGYRDMKKSRKIYEQLKEQMKRSE